MKKITKGLYKGIHEGIEFEIHNLDYATWGIYFTDEQIDTKVFDLYNDRIWITKKWATLKAKQFIEEL
jgi:hypothetical protein